MVGIIVIVGLGVIVDVGIGVKIYSVRKELTTSHPESRIPSII